MAKRENLKIRDVVHQSIKIEAAKRGISMQNLIEMAWLDFALTAPIEQDYLVNILSTLDKQVPDQVNSEEISLKHKKTVIEITSEELPWVQRLLKVLRSGKTRFIRAVTSNLVIFSDHCDTDHSDEDGSIGTLEAPQGSAGGSGGLGKTGTAHPGAKEALRRRFTGPRGKITSRDESDEGRKSG